MRGRKILKRLGFILLIPILLYAVFAAYVFSTNSVLVKYNFQNDSKVTVSRLDSAALFNVKDPCEITDRGIGQAILNEVQSYRYLQILSPFLKCITIDIEHTINGESVLKMASVCNPGIYREYCKK